MSEFPSGWIQKPLKSLVSLNEKLRDIEDDEDCGFVPMNLVPTKLMGKIQHEQKKWGDCKKGYTHFKDGDVLLAKITPCFENGKSVLVSGLPNGIGAGSTEYFVLRSELLDSRYLHAFAKTKQFKDDCTVRMTGSVGHKRVPKDYLLEYPIPVAPLNEQIRIADKLDSVLAKVDAAQARLEKIPTLLKRFRQSVLAAATSGELTREWRIEKSFTEWSSVLLKDICNSISDGDHQAPPQTESGVPFLVISNVSIGTLDLSKVTRYVPIEYYEGLKSLRKPALNDILYTVTGSFGIPVIVNTTEDFCFQRHIAIIKPRHDKINYKFLTLVLGAPEILRHANEVATGTAQKTVSLNNLRKFKIPMPFEDEQKEIVRRVESLFTLADTVEKQYLETKKRIDRLTQSLLAKAFRGELVPQDPNDEPAAELLKRIQVERNAQPPVKNKRAKSA